MDDRLAQFGKWRRSVQKSLTFNGFEQELDGDAAIDLASVADDQPTVAGRLRRASCATPLPYAKKKPQRSEKRRG
jgi:hypothetical protein